MRVSSAAISETSFKTRSARRVMWRWFQMQVHPVLLRDDRDRVKRRREETQEADEERCEVEDVAELSREDGDDHTGTRDKDKKQHQRDDH